MLRTRVIPCLLMKDEGLVKTLKFKQPKYIGDPINCIKIFNDKAVDELILLDISASLESRGPNFGLLEEIASECFMPLAYGGGVRHLDDIATLFSLGVEKVCLNSIVYENPALIREAAEHFGEQSIVVSIDVNKTLMGNIQLVSYSGRQTHKGDLLSHIKKMVALGAGEILINCVYRDGTMKGFDVDLFARLTPEIQVPIVACGGAGELAHLQSVVVDGGVSAVAVGSMFVFHGKHKGVLINVPTPEALAILFNEG